MVAAVGQEQGRPTFAVGAEWAYRLRDDAPTEHVIIRAVAQEGRKTRVDVEFLGGSRVGDRQTVPGARLRVLWAEAAAFDELTANWKRLSEYEIDEVESSAVSDVFDLLLPEDVVGLEYRPVDNAARVRDVPRFESLFGISTTMLVQQYPSFWLGGDLLLASTASLAIAERVCQANPQPVLDQVLREEAEAREKSKRGGTFPGSGGPEVCRTSPDYEYRFYLEYHRPRHELLRQWCGHRAVSGYERLLAAEAERHRLDGLLARAIDTLRTRGDVALADDLEREHEADRVTPYQVRPVPDRPLEPWELPVREVYNRRRWWSR